MLNVKWGYSFEVPWINAKLRGMNFEARGVMVFACGRCSSYCDLIQEAGWCCAPFISALSLRYRHLRSHIVIALIAKHVGIQAVTPLRSTQVHVGLSVGD